MAAANATARFRASYGRFLEWLVIVLMVVLAAEVTAGVIFRSIGQAVSWYDEIASVLLAWLTFYGSALESVKRSHIGCPELVELMAPAMRRIASIIAEVLVIAFFAALGIVGAWILPVLATDALVSIPSVPMSVVQSVIPISAALIIIAEITHLIDLVRAVRPASTAAGVSLTE